MEELGASQPQCTQPVSASGTYRRRDAREHCAFGPLTEQCWDVANFTRSILTDREQHSHRRGCTEGGSLPCQEPRKRFFGKPLLSSPCPDVFFFVSYCVASAWACADTRHGHDCRTRPPSPRAPAIGRLAAARPQLPWMTAHQVTRGPNSRRLRSCPTR